MNPNTPAQPDNQQINGAFLLLLQKHRSGGLLNDAADAVKIVTEAVTRVGKPGVIAIKITLTPAGSDAVEVDDEIVTKAPKAPTRSSIFFANPETGYLQRENPMKMLPGLSLVEPKEETTSAPLRDVAVNADQPN